MPSTLIRVPTRCIFVSSFEYLKVPWVSRKGWKGGLYTVSGCELSFNSSHPLAHPCWQLAVVSGRCQGGGHLNTLQDSEVQRAEVLPHAWEKQRCRSCLAKRLEGSAARKDLGGRLSIAGQPPTTQRFSCL